MTETVLIYILILLTVARLVFHLQPALLGSFSKVMQAKVREFIDSIVWAGVVALLLIHFVVRSFYIPSGSMLPTLEINDFILVNEMLYEFTDPARGDIVVFHPPEEGYTGDKTDLIKRVVGIAYDKLEVKDGKLFLNDMEMDEPFIKEPIERDFGPIVVEPGKVFVMGDNRNDSRDSRWIGQIPLENLVGRAEVIFFPFNRLRLFNIPR